MNAPARHGRLRQTLTNLALLCLLAVGAGRFVMSGLLPAATALRGDFSVTFPSEYFAALRPDWPPPTVWGAKGPGDPAYAGLWIYGPVMHFVTLPLFAAPTLAAVPKLWAAMNLLAVTASFLLVLRIASGREIDLRTVGLLAAMWMGFQPLINCLAQGNIEIVELALAVGGLAALQSNRPIGAGWLLGCSTMVKYLPVGFLGWMALRGFRRALGAAVLAMGVIALCAAVTLGWENSTTIRRVPGQLLAPWAGFHELSITSIFLHRAATPDPTRPVLRWNSREEMQRAQRAGLLTSGLVALAYAVLIWRRRNAPVVPEEIGVLFLLMLLLPPWNHDYYYVFALVPLSIVLVAALRQPARRILIVGTLVAYVMMSPPVPYSLIDGLRWFRQPVAYAWNFNDVPTFGALLLLALCTYQWLKGDAVRARDVRPVVS